MNWFLLILLLVMFGSMEIAPKGQFHQDYISKEKIVSIKGIFTILIVFSHFVPYMSTNAANDGSYLALRSHLSQAVVVMFWFYSGYGMMESIAKKGAEYVKGIPLKRFLPVFLRFAAIVLIYMFVQMCYGNTYGIKRIACALIGWDGFGNSNWYMFGTFVMYVCMYVAFAGIRKWSGRRAQYIYAAILTLLVVGVVCCIRKTGRDAYWYNTLLIFPLGVWYSLLKKPIEKAVMKNDSTYLLILTLAVGVYIWSFGRRGSFGLKAYTLWVAMFAVVALLLTMKASFNSPLLKWFGDHLFGVYMLQRIPMILLSRAGYIKAHPYSSLVIVFLTTMCLAVAFEYCAGKIETLVSRRRVAEAQ